MEADYDRFEIASVIGDHKLVDAESYERRYSQPDGLPLAPGYYVVYWPEHIRNRRFDEHALFHGPFRQRPEALAALESLRTAFETETSFLLRWLISLNTRSAALRANSSSTAAPGTSIRRPAEPPAYRMPPVPRQAAQDRGLSASLSD